MTASLAAIRTPPAPGLDRGTTSQVTPGRALVEALVAQLIARAAVTSVVTSERLARILSGACCAGAHGAGR